MTRISSAATSIVLLATLGTVGCASAPKPLRTSQLVEISAAVTAVDHPSRQMTIKGDAGDEFTVDVDPSVKNLSQVKVGDNVVARYYESIGADMRRAGDSSAPTIQVTDAVAALGQRPAALVGKRMTIPVTIVAVDTKAHVVTYYGADKRVRKLAVQKPEAKAFINTLKNGDEIVVTLIEALAVSVEPAK